MIDRQGGMSQRDLLLRTKLYIPPARPNLVPRPRLTERLNEGMTRKLTLISAPAGFGKTTLLSHWISDFGTRIKEISAVLLTHRGNAFRKTICRCFILSYARQISG